MRSNLRSFYWPVLMCALGVTLVALVWRPAQPAQAIPTAPSAFCETYTNAPLCKQGALTCTHCHTTPPALNDYGVQLKQALNPDSTTPLKHSDFLSQLPAALLAIEGKDADGDGVSNGDEIKQGTLPGDADSKPATKPAPSCSTAPNPAGLNICGYDPRYVYKKIYIDFCGRSPDYEQLQAFDKHKTKELQMKALKSLLGQCLDSEYWVKRDGVLWRMAHDKIRPVQSVKAGEDNGDIPLGDYYDDYNLYVFIQMDNRDVRELLTADYFVDYEPALGKTEYVIRESPKGGLQSQQAVSKDKRAGMLTTRWTLVFHTMFAAIPRATAAQAYRSYLGFDIARMEGLFPVPNEPADYDNKNVRTAGCKTCHSTLDAMSYPFSRYNGLGQGYQPIYMPDRMKRFVSREGARIAMTPESGFLMGKPVKDLKEWGQIAANSDAFAKKVVMDYWKLLLGGAPKSPQDQREFEVLWRDLKGKHKYGVERMLHALIETEAYGVP